MRNQEAIGEIEYDPSALIGRIGNGETPEHFIERLMPTQEVKCPWGSFAGKSPTEIQDMFFKFPRRMMDFPLALELGCGQGFRGSPSTTYPYIGEADTTLLSDHVEVDSPFGVPENYVQIDLTKPEQINLGGIRCHWIAASMVFTVEAALCGEDLGVIWPSENIMRASLAAIPKLLLPNGLLYIDPDFGFPMNMRQFANEHGLTVHYLRSSSILFQKGDE